MSLYFTLFLLLVFVYRSAGAINTDASVAVCTVGILVRVNLGFVLLSTRCRRTLSHFIKSFQALL